jgi:hypothetical protein
MDNNELLEKASKFLNDSHSFYGTQQTRMSNDIARYSDDTFWDNTLIEEYERQDRPHITWNLWSLFVNAISSPYTASPYHIQLEKQDDEVSKAVQESIDDFEANEDTKNKINEWLANTAITGQGFATVSIIDKSEDEQEVCLELIDDPTCVALDPCIQSRNGDDAEMGAIVNFVNINKAKRLYGNDIVGMDFPKTLPMTANCGNWKATETTIPVINFYFKDESGNVVFSKLCGNKVITQKVMPYTIIPIIRMTGYKVIDASRKKDYLGVVRKTYGLQLGANIGYSTLLERMNRSPKGNFLMPVGAIEGLEKYYQIAGKKQSLLYLYNGQVPPTPIKEGFETADLASTVEKSLEIMSSVLGIPLTGVNGVNFTEQTATQVLVQQTNSQSNVSCFYSSAYMAIRTLGRILLGLFSGDASWCENAVFSLQNGPDVITKNSKKRQELSLLSTLMPDNMKPVIAYHMSKTFDDEVGENMAKDILANMDPNIKIVSDTDMDPNAVHIMNGMKQTLDVTMQQLQMAKQQSMEQQKQIDNLTLQLTNMKAQRDLDWQKFIIQHQDDVRLKEASLMLDGKSIDDKAKAESQKAVLEGEKVALDAQKEQNRIAESIERDINSMGGI